MRDGGLGRLATCLALGAFLATPAFGQSRNRPEAAVADFRSSCSAQIAAYEATGGRGGAGFEQRSNWFSAMFLLEGLQSVEYLQAWRQRELAELARHDDPRSSIDTARRVHVCLAEVAIRHHEQGVPGFGRAAGPAASNSSAARPAASSRPANPPASAPARSVSAAYAARLAEGERLLATPAVQRALRNPSRTYDRSVRLTPAERAAANRSIQACQSEYEGAFADYYAFSGGEDAASAVSNLDINIVAFNARYAADAGRGDANAIETLRRTAADGGDADRVAKACVARHHLTRLGIPVDAGASGTEVAEISDPLPSAGTTPAGPRQQVAVDTDEYAARCLRALVPGRDAGAGGFGAVVNNCDFRIAYTLCNLNPRPGSWGESFACEAGRKPNYLEHVGPNSRVATHTGGAEAVYLLACRDPATPRNTEFQLGRGIIGECR